MTKLTTRLGLEIDNIDEPTGGIHLSGTWLERLKETVAAVAGSDFLIQLYEGQTPTGCRVFLVGTKWASRAMIIDPEDVHGLLYVAEDDGKPIDLAWIKPKKAIWLGELLETGYISTYDSLELEDHRNDRLEHVRENLV